MPQDNDWARGLEWTLKMGTRLYRYIRREPRFLIYISITRAKSGDILPN